MANWATTSYVIEGNSKTVKKIYDAILFPTANEGSKGWEGDVLTTLGIDNKAKRNDGTPYYLRGFISDEPRLEEKPDYSVLYFTAEEAWGVTDFDEILLENLEDINIYWQTEEPGMEVYETNDFEGKYFKDLYFADVCLEDHYEEDYFQDEESLYKWLAEVTEGKIKTKEDLEAFNANNESDDFIIVHKFKKVK